jgi:peptide chain release factor 1
VASRSSGAGGQHINTTDSSIKATHIPTGIVAVSQDERSQIQNRDKALDRLKLKVEDFYIQQAKKEIDKQRKEQLNTLKSGKNIYVFDYTKGVVSFGDESLEISKFVDGENI